MPIGQGHLRQTPANAATSVAPPFCVSPPPVVLNVIHMTLFVRNYEIETGFLLGKAKLKQ
jgi:hypothetical protein